MDWNSETEFLSSDDSSYDSDIIDSDIEADLYSVIHHQQETSLTNSNELNIPTIEYTSNENSIQEKSFQRRNCSEHPNKTNLNNSDKTRKNICANLPQNSKTYIEVQPIEYQNELNYGNSTKRKSSVITDLLNNIQSDTKRRKMRATNTKNKISKGNQMDWEYTSDEDSDIICIGSKEKEKQFQTNLSNNTIYLDCSSDSDDSWYERLSNRTSISFSNRNSKDLWYINNEDLYRFRRRSNRYHESELVNCSNCNEIGHFAKNCSFPSVMKCYICGNKHNPLNCRKRTCANCFRMGHDCRFCRYQILTCTLCKMTGHPSEECPDLWRRYHLTTSNKGIRTSRSFPEEPIFCYNCGISGHFGGNCKKKRMNVTSFQTWPVVINYVAPYSTCTNKKNMLNKPFIDFEENALKKLAEKNKKRKQRKILKYSQMKALQNQQSDFPRTPKTEILKQNNPDIIALSDFSEKQKKKQIEKEKKCIRKLEILRQKILDQPNNISIPLLDLSGQKELPYSFKSLRNRAKKERKLLRKLISETNGSNNNISVSLIDKN